MCLVLWAEVLGDVGWWRGVVSRAVGVKLGTKPDFGDWLEAAGGLWIRVLLYRIACHLIF